jgi:hypothetical protein
MDTTFEDMLTEFIDDYLEDVDDYRAALADVIQALETKAVELKGEVAALPDEDVQPEDLGDDDFADPKDM